MGEFYDTFILTKQFLKCEKGNRNSRAGIWPTQLNRWCSLLNSDNLKLPSSLLSILLEWRTHVSFKPSIIAGHKLFLGEGARKCNKSSHIPRKEKSTRHWDHRELQPPHPGNSCPSELLLSQRRTDSIIKNATVSSPRPRGGKSTWCPLLIWSMALEAVLFSTLALGIWSFFIASENKFRAGSAPEKVPRLFPPVFTSFFPINTLISFPFQTRYKF